MPPTIPPIPYPGVNKPIKASKKNYTAVKNAFDKYASQPQFAPVVALLGGSIAVVTVIVGIVVTTAVITVGVAVTTVIVALSVSAAMMSTAVTFFYKVVSELA